MRRAGWFHESHRHSLAARGISTGRKNSYYGMKEWLFSRSKEEQNIRDIRKGELRAHAMQRLLDAEKKGKIPSKAVEAFGPALENSLKLYDAGNPYDDTKKEIDWKIDLHLDLHKSANDKGNGLMPWSKHEEMEHAHHEKTEEKKPVPEKPPENKEANA